MSQTGTAVLEAFFYRSTMSPGYSVAPDFFVWTFDDGTTAVTYPAHGGGTSTFEDSTARISHDFTEGFHTYTVKAVYNGGAFSTIQDGTLEMTSTSFGGEPTSLPTKITTGFSATATVYPVSYEWDFGDGTTGTSTEPNLEHEYPIGVYTVTATAIYNNGDRVSASSTVNVQVAGGFDFGAPAPATSCPIVPIKALLPTLKTGIELPDVIPAPPPCVPCCCSCPTTPSSPGAQGPIESPEEVPPFFYPACEGGGTVELLPDLPTYESWVS
jgi:PKD repeat protein